MEANISLYELNRSIISQQGPLDPEEMPNKMVMMKDFAENTNNTFYMLYGKEIGYFTLFAKDSNWEIQTLDLAVIECLTNIGQIHSIELTANKDAIEIWIREYPKEVEQEGIITCLYLFPYDNGVVRIEK